MNFTLTINATPEFLGAINSLATALASKTEIVSNTLNNASTPTVGQAQQSLSIQQPMAQTYAQPTMQPQQQVQPQAQNNIPVTNPGTQPVQTPQQVQQQPIAGIPVAEQTYTMDQLAVAATQLMDAGRRNDLMGLLTSFGVQTLTMLPKEQYGAFATQLRAMGAKI